MPVVPTASVPSPCVPSALALSTCIHGNRQFTYLMQNGDIKLVANLEFRTRLFGSLNGAVFLDAGNVWNWKDEHDTMTDEMSRMTDRMKWLC